MYDASFYRIRCRSVSAGTSRSLVNPRRRLDTAPHAQISWASLGLVPFRLGNPGSATGLLTTATTLWTGFSLLELIANSPTHHGHHHVHWVLFVRVDSSQNLFNRLEVRSHCRIVVPTVLDQLCQKKKPIYCLKLENIEDDSTVSEFSECRSYCFSRNFKLGSLFEIRRRKKHYRKNRPSCFPGALITANQSKNRRNMNNDKWP